MFLLYCPYCEEERAEEEFHVSGEAHITRPLDPDSCTDEEWGHYLFFRKNPRGNHHELWHHSIGCRKYFNVKRDTQTYEIIETYKVGETTAKGDRRDRKDRKETLKKAIK